MLYQSGPKHLIHNDVHTHNQDELADWTAFKGNVATQFIADNTEADKPFFPDVWFDVPHTPYESGHVPKPFHFETLSAYPDEGLGRHRHVFNSDLPEATGQADLRKLLAIVTYVDHEVGRVLDASQDPNQDGDEADSILEDTLIVLFPTMAMPSLRIMSFSQMAKPVCAKAGSKSR